MESNKAVALGGVDEGIAYRIDTDKKKIIACEAMMAFLACRSWLDPRLTLRKFTPRTNARQANSARSNKTEKHMNMAVRPPG
jgi:hypothetical protein